MHILNSLKCLLKCIDQNIARDRKSVNAENVDADNIEEADSAVKHSHYPDANSSAKIDFIFNVLVELKSQFEIVAVNNKYISELKTENSCLKRNLEELTKKHNNLLCVASDLNARIKELENHKSSLTTAFGLVCCDGKRVCKCGNESAALVVNGATSDRDKAGEVPIKPSDSETFNIDPRIAPKSDGDNEHEAILLIDTCKEANYVNADKLENPIVLTQSTISNVDNLEYSPLIVLMMLRI